MLKRIFDVILSFFGLIVLSPVFIILMIWIKLDSKGPIFYRQVRVGLNGRDFYLLKFRSMRTGADKYGLLTIGGKDPRITNSGFFIRKYKLDEFPQLINVIKGDMSLVGPRPEVRKYVDLYTSDQLRVLSVKPGITDNASIVFRNENDLLKDAENPEEFYIREIMPTKLKYNIEYVDSHSLFKDLELIFKTFSVIILK